MTGLLNVAVPLAALVVILGVAAWLFDLGARRKEDK